MSTELGRHGCRGWWPAARFARPKRAFPLGGLGAAICPSGWSGSHQRVERFAPAGGAICTSGWSDLHQPTPAVRTAGSDIWPYFLRNPALSGQSSRSRESLVVFGINFAVYRCCLCGLFGRLFGPRIAVRKHLRRLFHNPSPSVTLRDRNAHEPSPPFCDRCSGRLDAR